MPTCVATASGGGGQVGHGGRHLAAAGSLALGQRCRSRPVGCLAPSVRNLHRLHRRHRRDLRYSRPAAVQCRLMRRLVRGLLCGLVYGVGRGLVYGVGRGLVRGRLVR